MDFDLTKEQKAIQKAVREFAEGELTKEVALDHELNHKFPFELRRKAGELGFLGIGYPEEYGGQGYGLFERVLAVEELCRRDLGLGIAVTASAFGTKMILRFGRHDQKAAYLPPVISGQAISGGAFTEPDHGSDISRLDTSAVRDGDEWVIHGTKMFISNASLASYLVILCQTDPAATRPYSGMSTIIVETDRPGFEATDLGEKMGLKMSPTAQVALNGVRVPLSNLVGIVGRGAYQTLEFFDEMRVEVAARALGGAQGAFDRALAYAKQRRQFGRRLADFQAIQHKLAEMATKIETARLISYKAAWTFDQGKVDAKMSSMAKLYAARSAVEVCEEAVQILGGYGYMLENEVERIYRDVRVTEIYEGTREIQKQTIARSLIGKDE